MNEIERNESVSDEPPRKGMDRKTLLVFGSFLIGLVLLIALNMR